MILNTWLKKKKNALLTQTYPLCKEKKKKNCNVPTAVKDEIKGSKEKSKISSNKESICICIQGLYPSPVECQLENRLKPDADLMRKETEVVFYM